MNNTRIALAAIAVAGLAAGVQTAASAHEWHRGEFEYDKGSNDFGEFCQYRITAHGTSNVELFGGKHEVEKAQARSIRDWTEDTTRLFGDRYADWGRAQGKNVQCNISGFEFICTAAANPCREHEEHAGWEERSRHAHEEFEGRLHKAHDDFVANQQKHLADFNASQHHEREEFEARMRREHEEHEHHHEENDDRR